jgi:DNA polymerase-3 subunit beta
MELIRGLRDDVLKKLQIVSNIVERRSTMPILSNVLIQKKGQTLQLLTTDIEIQIQTQLHLNVLDSETGKNDVAAVDMEGNEMATTVSARKLVDVLRSLQDNSEIVLSSDGKKMLLTSRRSRFSLQCLPAEGFPLVQEPTEWLGSVALSQKVLKKLLSQVHFSMALQDIRSFLNGVLLNIEADKVMAVATDAHRLSCAYSDCVGHAQAYNVIVPRKAVLELIRMLEDSDEPVHIDVAANQARFSFNGVTLITKLVEGKFPDYQRALPVNPSNHICLDPTLLLQALQRVSVLGSVEKIRSVRWVLANNTLRLMCSNAFQEESEEELEVEYAGPEIDVGFNVGYLLDGLNNVKSERMQFSFAEGNSSVLFGLPDQDTFKYLVMPMRL